MHSTYIRKKVSVVSFLFFICFSSVYSQITIGSTSSPKEGTLLDLKESNNKEGNSSKGLLLPRVQLSDLNNLYPMFDSDGNGGYTGAVKSEEDMKHIGLVVYVSTKFGLPINCPGTYVWNGNRWDNISYNYEKNETETHLYDRQGNEYTIASFGEAGVWMTQNLRTTVDPCGEPLTKSGASSPSKKYYEFPNKDVLAPEKYGLLYNWRAATNDMKTGIISNEGESTITGSVQNTPVSSIEEKGVQGLCPHGWHLPSDKEWNILEKIISESPTLYSTNSVTIAWKPSWNLVSGSFRGDQQGSSMISPEAIGSSTGGLSKTDGKGFNIYLLGYVRDNSAVSYGNFGFFWSSSAASTTNAWSRTFVAYSAQNYRGVSRNHRPVEYLYNIRCKKDD